MEITFIRLSKPISTLISSTGTIYEIEKGSFEGHWEVIKGQLKLEILKSQKKRQISWQIMFVFLQTYHQQYQMPNMFQFYATRSVILFQLLNIFIISESSIALNGVKKGSIRKVLESRNRGRPPMRTTLSETIKVFQRPCRILSKWHKVGQVAR